MNITTGCHKNHYQVVTFTNSFLQWREKDLTHIIVFVWELPGSFGLQVISITESVGDRCIPASLPGLIIWLVKGQDQRRLSSIAHTSLINGGNEGSSFIRIAFL